MSGKLGSADFSAFQDVRIRKEKHQMKFKKPFSSARFGSAERTRAKCNHHQSVCVYVCVNFAGGETQHGEI